MTARDLPEIPLTLDTRVINRSVRIKAGVHELPDAWRKGAVVIDADDVVIDFQGATLTPGGDVRTKLDEHEGYGILIKDRRNVTIRNARVHGYRFNIFVQGGDNIRIEDCDVSFSRGHRISRAGVPHDEWVVIRDVNDWRTYGAGIWLEKVHAGVVQRCHGCSAQNGIVLASSDHGQITDNDFSFNSGWGIALFESCDNVVSWNLADFCDRPWAGGLGADASGMAVSGGSHRNYIVGNSLTHGGDGFFLTDAVDGGLDTARKRYLFAGSSNDNVVACNDGSWSPANAFEGTFSFRNVYYRNHANHSGHGFWLGFSSDSLILDNEINHNRATGVAIEQGMGTRVIGNRLLGNRQMAVKLWAVRDEARDRHPSQDLEICDNTIQDSPTAVELPNSTDYYVGENALERAPLSAGLTSTKLRSQPSALEQFRASAAHARLQQILATQPKSFCFYRDSSGPQGWEWTPIEAFAPHDFRKDLATCRRIDASALELFLLEPAGTQIAAPEWVKLTPDPADRRRIRVEVAGGSAPVAEFRTCRITLSRGDRRQVVARNLVSAEWKLKWFDWGRGGQPLAFDDAAGWQALFAGPPVAQTTGRDLGPGWFENAPAPGLPKQHYALVATTRVKLAAGRQRFCATFDDGLRLKVDGKEVYSNWKRNRPQSMDIEVELAAGDHELEVQYCYESRYAVLIWYWPEPEEP